MRRTPRTAVLGRGRRQGKPERDPPPGGVRFGARLRKVYAALYEVYGPQRWWPAETPFEVMVGAVLTQNTAWSNVEKAIANLRSACGLDPRALLAAHPARLAAWLRPSGYFRVKARRLRSFCSWYRAQGGFRALAERDTDSLRRTLLSVPGIGPETADDILLYAFRRPVFVIDAYTRRLFARLGLARGTESYEELRCRVERALGREVPLFNEFHALIVRHAKRVCRPLPLCGECLLSRTCFANRKRVGKRPLSSRRSSPPAWRCGS